MKRALLVGAVAAALTLTALSQQRAAAQSYPPQCTRGGDVTFNTGITFGIHCTPKCGHWAPNCPPCGCGYPPPYGYPAYGYAPPPGYGRLPPALPAPPPGAPPAPPPPPSANAAPAGVQNVDYSYPTAYGYDYGYGYNYGYPLYQSPDYGYGR